MGEGRGKSGQDVQHCGLEYRMGKESQSLEDYADTKAEREKWNELSFSQFLRSCFLSADLTIHRSDLLSAIFHLQTFEDHRHGLQMTQRGI